MKRARQACYLAIVAGSLSLIASAAYASGATGSDVVAACNKGQAQCDDFFSYPGEMMASFNKCEPSDAKAVEMAIARWISQHPEAQNKDDVEAIVDAVDTLYPCSKR
jgi:hypothetical protein